MPSEQDERDATQFVAALGAAMAAANYPVTMVRDTMAATSRAFGLDNQFLAVPNYVQVGSPTGDGLYIVNPDFDMRYDQSFPLAQLVARAPTGTISPEEGMAELDRIRNQCRRFPLWVTVIGYAVQSTGLALSRSGRRDRRHQPRHHRGEPARHVGAAARRAGLRAGRHAVLLLWRAAIQLTSAPKRRALHD